MMFSLLTGKVQRRPCPLIYIERKRRGQRGRERKMHACSIATPMLHTMLGVRCLSLLVIRVDGDLVLGFDDPATAPGRLPTSSGVSNSTRARPCGPNSKCDVGRRSFPAKTSYCRWCTTSPAEVCGKARGARVSCRCPPLLGPSIALFCYLYSSAPFSLSCSGVPQRY